jgi:mannose-1-phosphate guanylyltransferase/phosphomannomutase
LGKYGPAQSVWSARGDRLANIDITPEFAVKLGAAYGSTLKAGSHVTVSRDQRSISRMVSRSLIAGLMSVGINVQNLEATAIPVARSVLSQLGVAGGIHVRLHPDRPDHVLIEFFDEHGIDIPKGKEKKIEGAYFKEDCGDRKFRRLGPSFIPPGGSAYSTEFEKHLNLEAVLNSRRRWSSTTSMLCLGPCYRKFSASLTATPWC